MAENEEGYSEFIGFYRARSETKKYAKHAVYFLNLLEKRNKNG
jgi:hypothetical protein